MEKKRRYGIEPYPPEKLRERRLSVYVTETEYQALEKQAQAVGMKVPAYLRETAFKRIPKSVPKLNQEAWAQLSKSAANLNQIAHRLNAFEQGDRGTMPELQELRESLANFRLALIGAKKVGDES